MCGNDGGEVTSKNITRESTLRSCGVGFGNEREGITDNFIEIIPRDGAIRSISEFQNNDEIQPFGKPTSSHLHQVLKCDKENELREKEMPAQERKIIPHVGSINETQTIIVKQNRNVLQSPRDGFLESTVEHVDTTKAYLQT